MKHKLRNLIKRIQNSDIESNPTPSLLSNKTKKLALIIGSSLLPLFITIIVIIIVIFGPILMVKQYFEDMKNDVAIFFDKVGNVLTLNGWCSDLDDTCEKQTEQKYLEQLDIVYKSYEKKGIKIDTELITATIFYGSTFENQFMNDEIEEEENAHAIEEDENVHLSDINLLASHMIEDKKIDYSKYEEYLINTYIPMRFKNLYQYKEDQEEAIKNIAEEIMSYKSLEEGTSTSTYYASLGTECSTISLKDRNGNITVHDLEEYVAGVVQAENGGAGDEALKLQAIAARSFAVKNCSRVIVNSIGDVAVDGKIDQAYTTPTERSKNAAQATEGLVLAYNGEVMTISFASYPKAFYRGGFPGYEASGYTCGNVSCSPGTDGRNWCSTILYKQPNMEIFNLYMPSTQLSGATWNGLQLNNQSGHCYGISQIASAYYENEKNYTYEQMIEEFLSPGVQIVSIRGTAEGGVLVAYNNNKYTTRTIQPESGNKHFFSNENSSYAGGFTGQCTWYVFGRANEVLNSVGSNLKWTIWSDAGQWYNQNIQMGTNAFEYSSDATKPRPGSIIVWGQLGKWGHVAFVETVNEDGTIDFTEANIGSVRSNSNPYGWQYVANQTPEQIRTRWALSGYYFQGYIYMLK